jgi:SAM-dependent methyltransferase
MWENIQFILKVNNREKSFTRGKGLLEPLLAQLRARQANRLIPDRLRHGRILDIGCGSYPYFLSHTSFKEKFAIDQLESTRVPGDIHWHTLDLNSEPYLPFEDEFFQVVTLLAVIEHLNPSSLVTLFRDIYRTLFPGGLLILTPPAAWSDKVLRWMSHLNLVSPEEIEEHVFAYTLPLLGWYFGSAGFQKANVRFDYFELFLNTWAIARR